MDGAAYRLDWSRAAARHVPGERAYHATNGTHHILVVASHDQLLAAERLAEVLRADDPDISVQHVVEDAIRHALTHRPPAGGELRLIDEDFE